MRKAWAAALGAMALAGSAAAQPLPDPEATLVEELVVQAVEPGPAWWRVRDHDTTVWILGVPEDRMPADLAWDRRYLERRMKGANSLILAHRVSLTGGLRDVPALLRARGQLKSKTPLEETLPEPLKSRFVAARERLGQPAGRYSDWTGLVAGERLIEDARRGAAVSVSEAAIKLAKREKVKLVDPARYDAVPFIRTALDGLTPAIHQQCLESAVSHVEAPPGRARAAAEGWARGDLTAAVSEPRGFEKCVLLLGGGAELWRRARDDRAAAIVKALETPGHSVAVVSLRQWLAQEGIAQALVVQGVEVLGPGEAG